MATAIRVPTAAERGTPQSAPVFGVARPSAFHPRAIAPRPRSVPQAASTDEATTLLSMQAHPDGTVTYTFGSLAEAAALDARIAKQKKETEVHAVPHVSNGRLIHEHSSHVHRLETVSAVVDKDAMTSSTEALPSPHTSPAIAEAALRLDELLKVETRASNGVAQQAHPAIAAEGGTSIVENGSAVAAHQGTTTGLDLETSHVALPSTSGRRGASFSSSSSAPDNNGAGGHRQPHALDFAAASKHDILGRYTVLCDSGKLDDALLLLKDCIRAGRKDVLGSLKHYRFLRPAARQRAVKAALRFIQLLPREFVDSRSYNMLLSVCARARDVKNALHAADMLRAAGLRPDTILYTNLIKVCAEAGDAESAFALFNEMQASKVKLDKQIFATLVAACAEAISRTHAADRRTQLVLLERAFGLIDVMDEVRLQPDVAVWNAIITAAGRAGQLQRAFAVLEEMLHRGNRPNVRTYACLVDACARGRDKQLALRVYNKARREGHTNELILYSAAINACIRSDEGADLDAAMAVYMDMQKAGVAPDSALYGALMMVAGRSGDLDLTLELHSEMIREGLQPCAGTESALITVYVHHGKLKEAQQIYRRLRESGKVPHLHSVNALINAHGKALRMGDAVALVRDLVKAGVQPDSFTFAAVLSACQWCDEAELAVDVYRAMRLRGVRLDEVHAMLLLRMCYGRLRKQWAPEESAQPLVMGRREQERRELLQVLTPSSSSSSSSSSSLLRDRTAHHVPWQAHAFHIYRATVAAGVKPSMRLLNLMLSCLRVPWAEANDKVNDGAGIADVLPIAHLAVQTQALHAGLPESPPIQRKIGLESVYHVQAQSILEEAIVSGLLPSFQADDGRPIDLRDFPPAIAEVYALMVVAALLRQIEARRNLKHVCTFVVPPYDGRKVFLPSHLHHAHGDKTHASSADNGGGLQSQHSNTGNDGVTNAFTHAGAHAMSSADLDDVTVAADEAYAAAARGDPLGGDERTGLGVAGVLRRLRLWARERSQVGIIQLEENEVLRWSKMIQREVDSRRTSVLTVQTAPHGPRSGGGLAGPSLVQQMSKIRATGL